MKIQPYQFVKYDKNTSIEHIEKVHQTGAVVCFDFEDGIMNPLEVDKSATLKEEARGIFSHLYSVLYDFNKDIKTGIRVNSIKTEEFARDLITLKGKRFDSILIPKIEHPGDIQLILARFKEFDIQYKNLIPVIESKKGLENLENILQPHPEIGKIAFGHCDYNLDIDAYPFFHQDSWEYWKWIHAIIDKIKNYSVQLINSPYLNTSNEDFFCSMIAYITTHKKDYFCGQVTLSTRQSILCHSENPVKKNFTEYLENKNLFLVDKKIALALVHEFEANNKQKGLSKSNNKFISLQEYLASKKLINDRREVKEICFVGGCFPVQYNIVYEDLFHQQLRRKLEHHLQNKLHINIIRYERFSTLPDKIKNLAGSKKLDLLIFHVRPEPYLRLIKLFYQYIDDKGYLKWSLNLPYFNLLMVEKYDILDLGRIFHVPGRERNSIFYKFLITCNYIFGSMIGNKRYALKSYLRTVKNMIDFCHSNHIKYIILGPNRRSNTHLEPFLCRDLDLYISGRTNKHIYVCGYEKDTGKKMNQENGIHVTSYYHELIAEKLYKTIITNRLLNPE